MSARGRAVTLGALVVGALGALTYITFEPPEPVVESPTSPDAETPAAASRDRGTRRRGRSDATEQGPDERVDVETLSVPELLPWLERGTDEQRRAARRRLSSLERVDPVWLPRFLDHVHQLDADSRDALLLFGPDAIEDLVRATRRAPHPGPGHLAQVLSEFGRRGHVERLAAAFEASGMTLSEEQWAMNVLADAGPDGVRVVAEWIARGRSGRHGLRRWARSLGAGGLPLVRAQLVADGGKVTSLTLNAMPFLEGAGGEFVQPVTRALEENAAMTYLVSTALPGMGEAALPLARKLLDSPYSNVRRAAYAALPEMGMPGRTLAEEVLARMDADDEDRALLLRALTAMGRADAVLDQVRARIASGQVTAQDIDALASAGPSGVGILQRHWETWVRSPDASIRAAAARTTPALGDDLSAYAYVLGRLANDDDALVSTGALLALLAPRDGRVHAAAGLGESVRRLYETRNDPIVVDRALSERGSGRIGRSVGPQPYDAENRLLIVLRILTELGHDAGDQAHHIVRSLKTDVTGSLRDELLTTLLDIGGSADEVALAQITEPNGNVALGLRLLREGAGSLSSRAQAVLWELARSERNETPRRALRTLRARGAVSVASVPDLVDLAQGDNKDAHLAALRALSALAPEVEKPVPVLAAALTCLDADRATVRSAAASVIVALGQRAASAVPALLQRAKRHPLLARALGAIGPTTVGPSIQALDGLAPTARKSFEDAFLRGAREASAVQPQAHTRSTCRAWLEARYGPFETRTGLPRDIPKERSDLLRWAIHEATVVE